MDDVRGAQFSAFVGSHLPQLVADPSSAVQLASQQSAASAMYDAWKELKSCDTRCSRVVDYLNRPLGLPPLVLTLEVGHVSACALEINGDQVAIGGKDGSVRCYSLHAKGSMLWKRLHRPQNPESHGDVCTDISTEVKALRFYADPSSGGRALASAADIVVRLWDADGARGGMERGHLPGHLHVTNAGGGQEGIAPEGPCQCKHYLLDGKWRKDRRGFCGLEGHSTTIADIALSEDAELLASSDTHDTGGVIKLWCVRKLRQLHALFGHASHDCASVAFGSDGNSLISIGNDGCVLLWRWERLKLGDTSHRFADGGLDVTPPALVGCIRLPWSNGERVALAPNGSGLLATVCIPMMTSNAVLAVYDLARVVPPVDASVIDAVTAALAVGGDGPKARESEVEFGARTELARCLRRDGYLKVATRLSMESAGADEKTGAPLPPPYSDRLRSSFDASVVSLDASTSPPVVAPLNQFDQAPYWPQAVRVTEKSSGCVLATYCDPCVHRMRNHQTKGDDKAGPPPCTCKSDWGELVHDALCAVNGHSGYIHTIQYTPDGSFLVSSSKREILLWDGRSHAPIATLRAPHADRGSGAACAARVLVSWGGTQLKVWDVDQVVRAAHGSAHAPQGHAQPVTGLVACTTSHVLLSCSQDQTVAAWAGERELSRMRGHMKAVRSCALSPDGSLVASGSEDRHVRIFRTSDGELLHSWHHPGRLSENGVSSVAWSPDQLCGGEHMLVTANGEGNAIAFWRVPPVDAAHRPVLLEPTSASDDTDGAARLVKELQELIDKHGVAHLAKHFHETGDGRLKPMYRPEIQSAFEVTTVDAERCVVAPATVLVANSGTWVKRTVVITLRATGEVLCRAPHPLRLCLQGHESHDEGCLCHWARFGKRPAGNCPLAGHSWEINSLHFARNGMLASSSKDQSVRLWELDATRVHCLATLEGFGDSEMLVAWAPSGHLLASGGSSIKNGPIGTTAQVLALWDTSAPARGVTCKELPLPDRSTVVDLCWSGDGETLAVAACPGHSSRTKRSTIVLYTASGQQTRHWVTSGGADPTKDEIRAICFVGNERAARFIASVGDGGTCRVWRVADGTCVRAFHSGSPLTHVARYHAEGQADGAGPSATSDCRIACAGRSGAVCLLQMQLPASFEPGADDLTAQDLSDGARGVAAMAERGRTEGIFAGLDRVLSTGVSNGEVLRTIEALCMAVAGRALETADHSDGDCVCCMSAPRSVRFACGHCVCCGPCADRWQSLGGGCPACRAKLVVVERGVPEGASAYEREPPTQMA